MRDIKRDALEVAGKNVRWVVSCLNTLLHQKDLQGEEHVFTRGTIRSLMFALDPDSNFMMTVLRSEEAKRFIEGCGLDPDRFFG